MMSCRDFTREVVPDESQKVMKDATINIRKK